MNMGPNGTKGSCPEISTAEKRSKATKACLSLAFTSAPETEAPAPNTRGAEHAKHTVKCKSSQSVTPKIPCPRTAPVTTL